MSFLGWLFGGRRGRAQEQARVLSADEQMRRLLARFGALGMEKQAGLQELVGEAGWSGDVAAQSLTFDNGFSCRIQAIGSYSLRNDTWRWAWTNAKAGWPDEALADARAMREYGRTHGLALLLDETDFALERRWVPKRPPDAKPQKHFSKNMAALILTGALSGRHGSIPSGKCNMRRWIIWKPEKTFCAPVTCPN